MGAANILRGPIGNADFKAHIFPLLFFKRISDIYDEEHDQVSRTERLYLERFSKASLRLLAKASRNVTMFSYIFFTSSNE